MIKKNKKLDYLFYLIPLFLMINLFMRWKLVETTSYDTWSYIDLAEHFPYIIEAKYPSVFPLGYPIWLRINNLFFNDYMISYKVGAFLCLVFSLLFVKIKDFYWREIWVLFTFYSFLRITPWAWSETLIIPLLIMVFYYNHQFLNEKIKRGKFITFYPILLFACVLVKYSSLFFIVAHFIFVLFLSLIKDKKVWDYLKVSILSSILSGIYLLNNYFITGYAMGMRNPPDAMYFNIRLSLANTIFSLNPLFHGRGNYLGYSFGWSIAFIFGGIFALFFCGIILRYLWLNLLKNKNLSNTTGGKILIFNTLNFVIFLLGTIYSYFTTKIDILDYRLLLGYYSFFFFAVIVAFPEFRHRKMVLLGLGLFCGIVNILNLL